MGICNIKDGEKYYLENIFLFFGDLGSDVSYIIYEIVVIICGIIFNFFYVYFYILVIQKLTPMHAFIVDSMTSFFFSFFSLFFYTLFTEIDITEEIGNIFFIIKVIRNIIIIIGLLVYLEIIVLKFCGFDIYTRENIIKRSVEIDDDLRTSTASGDDKEDLFLLDLNENQIEQ
jgi:hypothetical protein